MHSIIEKPKKQLEYMIMFARQLVGDVLRSKKLRKLLMKTTLILFDTNLFNSQDVSMCSSTVVLEA